MREPTVSRMLCTMIPGWLFWGLLTLPAISLGWVPNGFVLLGSMGGLVFGLMVYDIEWKNLSQWARRRVGLWVEDFFSSERKEIKEAKIALRTLSRQGGESAEIQEAKEVLEQWRENGRVWRMEHSFLIRRVQKSEARRNAGLDRARDKLGLLKAQLKDPL